MNNLIKVLYYLNSNNKSNVVKNLIFLSINYTIFCICPPARFYIELIGDMNNLVKVLYLNSNSKSNVVKNLMSLTEAALLPVRVVPVDIAPHTVRLEMVSGLLILY